MNEPELDPNLGIEANYHSPFGPKFLDFFLKGPIREKLKEIVNHHRAASPPIEGLAQITDEPWTCGLSSGRLEHISKKIDDEEFDGFAGNTVSKLIKAYVTNYIELSDAQKENGITQKYLADQLGVTQVTVTNWVKCKNKPTKKSSIPNVILFYRFERAFSHGEFS